jgi:leader peptidase (prepilin peptidase)/N-methyltransferase
VGAQIIAWLFVILFGACVGSFLNVCIYRLPWEKSILWPGSHCPRCLNPVRFYDNIPIVSWFVLRGRCRDCGESFSARYMLIEAFTAGLFVLVLWLSRPVGMSGYFQYGVYMFLLSALIAATVIDLDLQIIPDSVTVPGIVVGLASGFVGGGLMAGFHLLAVEAPARDPNLMADGAKLFRAAAILVGWGLWVFALIWQVRWSKVKPGAAELILLAAGFVFLAGHSAVLGLGLPAPALVATHPRVQGLATSLIGMLVGAGLIWVVRVMGAAVLRKEAMGFGDVTLMAMIGAFLGWQPTVLVFFMAPFLGLVVGLVQWLVRGERVLPYGPYLSLAAAVTLLGWQHIWPVVANHFDLLALVPVEPVIFVTVPVLILCLVKAPRE